MIPPHDDHGALAPAALPQPKRRIIRIDALQTVNPVNVAYADAFNGLTTGYTYSGDDLDPALASAWLFFNNADPAAPVPGATVAYATAPGGFFFREDVAQTGLVQSSWPSAQFQLPVGSYIIIEQPANAVVKTQWVMTLTDIMGTSQFRLDADTSETTRTGDLDARLHALVADTEANVVITRNGVPQVWNVDINVQALEPRVQFNKLTGFGTVGDVWVVTTPYHS